LSDLEKSNFESSRDTSPLALDQLSDGELELILGIEQRLAEAKGIKYKTATPAARGSQKQYSQEAGFARVQERYRRVLLLDGGRGTGKTSLLTTLVKKWHFDAGLEDEKWADKDEYKDRFAAIQKIRPDIAVEAPTYLRVIRILDFDPLPPGMPLLAGIIQALRPLADRYGPQVPLVDDTSEDFPDTLVDLWRKLFRAAVLGWSAIPEPNGLVEELLDREEQIKDWQRIADDWQSFVSEVLDRGMRILDSDKLTKDTVFVIMIDDVDLQVARVQELLPALRLLYHPRVFFLVAADRLHMIDMLKLDFFGQQNKLAHHRNAKDDVAIDMAKTDRWASDLAHSAFQKVFPKRNQWKLKRLSILEFLAFPRTVAQLPELASELDSSKTGSGRTPKRSGGVPQNFLADLSKITKETQPENVDSPGHDEHRFKNAGELILHFAREAERAKLPGVMPYRAAEQLRQYVMSLKESRPDEVLARLLSEDADDHPAVVQSNASGVNVSIAGELAALYRRGRTELAGNYNIVLSERPDFVFLRPGDKSLTRMSTEPDNRFNFTGALIAKMLEESGFLVDAAALRWETYLSLAWTEWPSLGASFAWTRHKHPRPDELLEQTQSWAEFIRAPIGRKDKFERFAYAWVYHQRKWSDHQARVSLDPTQLTSSGTSSPWRDLLDFKKCNQQERERWQRSTLPLLARPELGFPPAVQKQLLTALPRGEGIKRELNRQRRRLVTDAVVAAGMQRGEVDSTLPSDEKIEEIIKTIDQMYVDGYGKNLWAEIIEQSGRGRTRGSSKPIR
jgi:hypothetical protein